MATFGIGGSRVSQGRGGSPGFRFTLYAILSFWVMFMDQRHHWLEGVRSLLMAAAYPLELVVSSPSKGYQWLEQSLTTREALEAQNKGLKARLQEMELRSMRYEALATENGQLRGLRDALPPVVGHWLPAEIVNLTLNSLRQRVLINRGSRNGVFRGQALLDDTGIIGQTTHVGPWSAEVILITDPEHAIPVEIARTGLRTIAVGAGDTTSLALPYLPANADVKQGDLLMSSGLGGVFPAGYPVAKVTEVHRDAVQPLAQVRAIPLSKIDTAREVTLVWFKEDHPAAPAENVPEGTDLNHGNPNFQPQVAPPKPVKAPAAPETSPAPDGTKPGAQPSPTGTPGSTAAPSTSPGAGAKPATGAGKAPPDKARATKPAGGDSAGVSEESRPTVPPETTPSAPAASGAETQDQPAPKPSTPRSNQNSNGAGQR